MRKAITGAFLLLLASSLAARADEQMTPLAESGDWMAAAHSEGMESAPDFCVAMDVVDHFLFRADSNDIEVRYVDDSWSLPANVTGNLTLSVDSNTYVLPISDNTNTMVMAEVTQDKLMKIVADMNKASTMQLTPGSAQPVTISLNGSNQAVTAFLTCANISQPGNTGGANPFQAPSSNSSGQ